MGILLLTVRNVCSIILGGISDLFDNFIRCFPGDMWQCGMWGILLVLWKKCDTEFCCCVGQDGGEVQIRCPDGQVYCGEEAPIPWLDNCKTPEGCGCRYD